MVVRCPAFQQSAAAPAGETEGAGPRGPRSCPAALSGGGGPVERGRKARLQRPAQSGGQHAGESPWWGGEFPRGAGAGLNLGPGTQAPGQRVGVGKLLKCLRCESPGDRDEKRCSFH